LRQGNSIARFGLIEDACRLLHLPSADAGSTGCGKNISICHSERSEESLSDLSIRKEAKKQGEILRFAQNDSFLSFSAACLGTVSN
jgi:hypothetical protein